MYIVHTLLKENKILITHTKKEGGKHKNLYLFHTFKGIITFLY